MASTQAKGGFGAKFQRSADNGATYSSIAEIGDVSGGEISKILDDATHMESPGGFTERIAVGGHDTSPITFQMSYLDADSGQAVLKADNNSGTTAGYYRVLYPSGTRALVFRGFVTKIGNSWPQKGKMVNSVEITPTGTLTLVSL